MVDEVDLHDRLEQVLWRIAAAAWRSGRRPEDVTLIAVCKTWPTSVVKAAYYLGLRHFGENRVQEAAAKFSEFRPADLVLHLIGHLQSNKVRQTAALFDSVDSLDSLGLAGLLAKQAAVRPTPLPVLLEVNVAGEESKFGLAVEAVLPILRDLQDLPSLRPLGLMTVAPVVSDPEEVRPVFRRLRELRDECQQALGLPLPELSMGMTNDYAVAIEEGATAIRVGRALFGERA